MKEAKCCALQNHHGQFMLQTTSARRESKQQIERTPIKLLRMCLFRPGILRRGRLCAALTSPAGSSVQVQATPSGTLPRGHSPPGSFRLAGES
eukprot:6198214-Pleurochrysis_carterae.AAC.1